MKHSFIIILSLISFSISAQIRTINTVEQTQELSEQVIEHFKNNEISKSYSLMKNYWPADSTKIANFEEKTINQMNMLSEIYGKSIGHVKTSTKKISNFTI